MCANLAHIQISVKRNLTIIVAALLCAAVADAEQVRVCTSHGAFTIALSPEAPRHVANFLRLVDDGFYNGTQMHRVVRGTLVQGGAFDRNFVRRPPGDPVVNESDNGLGNERGAVAAARLREPDSAGSQFFINLRDNDDLDASSRRPGYTVFGHVTSGLEVLDAIGRVPTGPGGPLSDDVPETMVVIDAITRITPDAGAAVAAAGRTATADGNGDRSGGDSDRDGGDDIGPGDRNANDGSDLGNGDAGGDVGNGNAAGSAAEARPANAPPKMPELPAAVAANDARRARCEPLLPAMLVAEAEAAFEAGLLPRARYAVDNYFVTAGYDDPEMRRAQALFRRLPLTEQSGIAPLIAHCPSAAAPEVPSGRSASLDQMEAAQAAIRSFLMTSEAFLDCLSEVIDDGSLDDAQEVAAVGAHNEAVSLMERAAEDFNTQLRIYRGR